MRGQLLFLRLAHLRANSWQLLQGCLLLLLQATPFGFRARCRCNEAETKGRQGVPPTPWQCTWSLAVHMVPCLPHNRGRDQGTAISDRLPVHIVPRLPRKRGGEQGTAWRTSDPLAIHMDPHLPRKRGGNRGTPGRISDPLATWQCHINDAKIKGRQGVYATPLAVHIVPRLPRKLGGDQRIPGRTSWPCTLPHVGMQM